MHKEGQSCRYIYIYTLYIKM